METAMKIRGWILGDGRSIHSVARETGISRTTIQKYLKNPEQPRYQRRQPRVGSKLNAQFEARLRELFEHDLSLRRRDRRTAKKLYEELVAEGYTGSYSPVQRFVSELKKSSGTDGTDAFIPLYFAPGERVSDLLCMSDPVHASPKGSMNDHLERNPRRTAEGRGAP